MAILGYRRARRRPQYATDVYTVAARAHQLVARIWPRKRGSAKTTSAKLREQDLATRQQWIKVLKAPEVEPMREATKEIARRYSGQKGSQIIRHRDVEDMRLSGRLFAIEVPGVGTFWPEAVAQDISDALDWLEPLYGSIMTRTADTWLSTVPCQPGSVCTLTIDARVPTCCEPAREATPREAVDSSP